MSLNNTDLTAPAVRRIIQAQPDYWVFMLAVELLRPGLAEVQLGYDELEDRPVAPSLPTM
ncbi:MAG: hypothetical protein IPK16_05280 [Anaerolineales bacterium]|nr:hypothetical protein [Anaerolineales bacterium]